MKHKRPGVHICYLLVILTLVCGIVWLWQQRSRTRAAALQREESRQSDLASGMARLCSGLSGDLYSAADAPSPRLYAAKLVRIRAAAGQALVLLSANGRQTPWISFWQSLEDYADQAVADLLESDRLPEDRQTLRLLAELTAWLADHPAAALEEDADALPDDLKLPTLQSAYAVEEKKTLQVAMRALGVRGGLSALSGTPPGVRSYGCSNARVDVLQSGSLLYLSLRLPTKPGSIGSARAAEVFSAFAKQEGLGKVEIIDLYRMGDHYYGRLAPTVKTAEAGVIPDLDRSVEIACTAWSGTVCYFSAGRYYTPRPSKGQGGALAEAQIEAMAAEKGARIGPPFLYSGRICRPLIAERLGFAGRVVHCIDAVTLEEVDLFYVSHSRYGERALY